MYIIVIPSESTFMLILLEQNQQVLIQYLNSRREKQNDSEYFKM